MHTSPRLRTLLEAGGIWLLRLTFAGLPARSASWLGAGLGAFLFSVLRLRRRATLATLATALGESTTAAERRRIAARCYRHFGALLAEFIVQPRLVKRLGTYIELENPQLLRERLRQGHGVLVAAGHLGNWELMGCAIAADGHSFTAYVGRQHNPIADAFVNDIRQRTGWGTVPKRAAMRGMLRALKGGGVLGMLSDQHFSRNRYFVRFFGKPVSVAPGMASLIRHTGVPAVFAENYRVGRLRYRTRFTPLSLAPPSDNEELDLLRILQVYFDALEAAVRRHPEQYFWMHKRWRPPPDPEQLSPTNRAFLAGQTPLAEPAGEPPGAGAAPPGDDTSV